MDENWYTKESVWSLSFFYPDPQEDQKKKKRPIFYIVLLRIFRIGSDNEEQAVERSDSAAT